MGIDECICASLQLMGPEDLDEPGGALAQRVLCPVRGPQ